MLLSRFLLAVSLSILGLAASAQVPVVTNPTFGDDSYVHVPLQFGFPFYGRTFTNSWMHSNGVVSFFDPAAPIEGAGYNPGSWAYCCSGERPTPNLPQFSYMIAPLWTDLYPVASSTFRTEGTSQYQLYQWNNIAEISNMSNLNSFSLELRPSGYIGATYSAFRIQNQQTWVGTIGDPAKSEWNEIYYGVGVPGQSLKNWSLTDTGVIDQCVIDPTSSPTCSGYTDAMCVANPLFSPTCSGYDAAYLAQQCTANTLYSTQCPGYAVAYYSYQCSINTLYHTGCPGYAQAYFDQQCALDAFYNTQCPGYVEAYAKKYILASNTTTEPVVTATDTAEPVVAPAPELTAAPAAAASPADSATAAVQLAPQPAAVTVTTAAPAPAPAAAPAAAAPMTTRQVLAQRRLEAARAQTKPDAVAAQMDSAATMEQQAELQNVVLGAMGFVAGFDAYGRVTLPDAAGYRPFEIYRGQQNVDSPASRGLTSRSDRIHQDMVDGQYNK